MGIADGMKRITEDIISSYDLRVKSLGQLVGDVHETLNGFMSDRKKMSAEQAQFLGGFVGDLTRNVGNLLDGFQKDHKEMTDDLRKSLAKNTKDIETHVRNKLKEFSDAHADMSEEQRKDLAKFAADLVNGTRKMLKGLADENSRVAANWGAMSAAMAKRRGGKPIGVEARAGVKTVEEAVAKPKKKRGRPKKRG